MYWKEENKMRISIRKDDPGYHHLACKCKVLLDSKEAKGCFTADEENGEAHCFVIDDKGLYVMNNNQTKIKEIVLHGKVEIVIPDDAQARWCANER